MKAMKATQEQIDRLAKLFQRANSGDEEGWEGLCLDADTEECVVTRDTLDNFRRGARECWAEASGRQELDGAIYWESVQAKRGERRTALIVMDCGEFRLSYRQ